MPAAAPGRPVSLFRRPQPDRALRQGLKSVDEADRLPLPILNSYYCPCPRGLEPALAAELAALGAVDVVATGGGAACRGPLALAYRLNLEARLPSRVLLRLGAAPYRTTDDLYRLAHDFEWEDWFGPERTLRVDITAVRSPLASIAFATLRIKDGIVDRLRARTGRRPSIDTAAPDVRVVVYLHGEESTVYLDLSGEPLFKRGWRAGRDTHGAAPLKENLAAGLLALAGWQPQMPLLDLFCGAGTIVIEAAQLALGRPPGGNRGFGIERLALHDPALARDTAEAARQVEQQRTAAQRETPLQIGASDIDGGAVALARANLERAGVPAAAVRFEIVDAIAARPPWPEAGLIVSNPPYDERVPIEVSTWRAFGATLRGHFGGWNAFLLAGDRGLPGRLGLRESRKTPLFNGAIECRLFEFRMRKREPD
ncbi:MAG: class I SAM-dependent RNA methyltransferase [Lautropia sp.]